MLAFEKLKTDLVVPWHSAPKIHFLVNKLFLQNNPSNSTFIIVKSNVSDYICTHTHTGIYLFFFARGTELQVLQAEVLTKGYFGAFVLES